MFECIIMTAVTMMTCREYGVDSEIGMGIMNNLMILVLVLVVLRNKYLVVRNKRNSIAK